MKLLFLFMCYLGLQTCFARGQSPIFYPISPANLKTPCRTPAGEDGTYEMENECDQAMLFSRIGRTDDIDYKGFVGDLGIAVCCVNRTVRVPSSNAKLVKATARGSAGPAAQNCGVYCLMAKDHIIGGDPANLNEFPHMVALGYFDQEKNRTEFNCGGTLISDRFVLTAAHCCYKKVQTPHLARLGKVRTKSSRF